MLHEVIVLLTCIRSVVNHKLGLPDSLYVGRNMVKLTSQLHGDATKLRLSDAQWSLLPDDLIRLVPQSCTPNHATTLYDEFPKRITFG